MSKWIEKNGNKYRLDGKFYIAENESYVIYHDVQYNLIKGYYKRERLLKE
jgi:hypothetical protein